MSNDIFPTLRGLKWDRKRTPIHNTTVLETASGREYRARRMASPRYKYSFTYDFLRDGYSGADDLRTLLGFFNRHGGQFDSWLFLDPDDSTATAQVIGVGDSSATTFQLVRTLGGFVEPVYEPATVAVSVDGVPATNVLWQRGGFDGDGGMSGLAVGWAAYETGSGGTITRDQAFRGDGGLVQRIFCTALGAAQRAGVATIASAPVTAGETYTLGVDLGSGAPGFTAVLYIEWRSASASTGNNQTTVPVTGTAYTRATLTAAAPADTTHAFVYLWMTQGTGAAASLFLDRAKLERGSTATAFSAVQPPAVQPLGRVVFPTAPASGAVLGWTGTFYWRCRFVQDQLEFNQFMSRLWNLRTLEFVTVKP